MKNLLFNTLIEVVRNSPYEHPLCKRANFRCRNQTIQLGRFQPDGSGGGIVIIGYNYFRTGQYAEDLTYDKNGNILNLDRFGQEELGQPIQIDELTYTYDGNRLLKVADGTNNPDGFKDGD